MRTAVLFSLSGHKLRDQRTGYRYTSYSMHRYDIIAMIMIICSIRFHSGPEEPSADEK